MRPAARLQAAADILDVLSPNLSDPRAPGVERALRDWGAANRYAGSGDRAAIGDIVFNCLRCWRSYGAMIAETGRGRMIASLVAGGADLATIDALGFGDRHAPAPLTDAERMRVSMLGSDPLRVLEKESRARATRLDWPEWLWPGLEKSVGSPAAELLALRRRAALDLRVNLLRANPAQAVARLNEDGIKVAPAPLSPIGLRAEPGARINRSGAYQEGLVELQDAASQVAALLSTAAPGRRVLDYCAGGGGKTLALAAMMAGRGELIAHDVAPGRMKDLPARLARAGARADIRRGGDLRDLENGCDLVFVDAPCSGSGAWARQPEAKWRLDAPRLAELTELQARILDHAATLVCPGGAVLYATCSLLRIENANQCDDFLARRPDFSAEPLGARWRDAGILGAPPGGRHMTMTPATHGADGFFVALLVRRP